MIKPLLPSEAATDAFMALPKTDMHLHIEGAIGLPEYRSVVSVDDDWVPPAWAPDFRYENFADFENFILGYADDWFTSPQRYADSAAALFARKLDEGVRYAEVSFGFIVCEMKGLPVDEVVDAITSVVPDELSVRLFMGFHHESWSGQTEKALSDALALAKLDGIDLHGPELYPVRDWMVPYWRAAREAGKFTKAHAGELGPGWHVAEAVEKLGVGRVEHGFRAADDPALVQMLIDHSVVLDVCPVSNFKLKTVESYAAHPLKSLMEAGVSCTINTDDPFIFGNTVNDDYRALAREGGFTAEELVRLVRNGFEAALLPEERKAAFLAEIDATGRELLKEESKHAH
jgi:adenosine deaminase